MNQLIEEYTQELKERLAHLEQSRAGYARMIDNLDDSIAKVKEAIERLETV